MKCLHFDPMIITIDNFLTSAECDEYVAKAAADDGLRSPTVGKDAASAGHRTSTTWHHKYSDATELLARTCEALGVEVGDEGIGLRRFEEVRSDPTIWSARRARRPRNMRREEKDLGCNSNLFPSSLIFCSLRR